VSVDDRAISVVPANEAVWADLQTVFGSRGLACRCQCQRYKLRRGEAFANFPAEERAVEPRPAYEGLLRNNRVPREGRDEDRSDPGVWALTCLFTRAGYRRRGISRALARAAVDFARRRGATALEGYPMTVAGVILEELHVGTTSVFTDAGYAEVSRPTSRRAVMRIDF
jgi:GNAT superfamily N-acetyltransferase